MILQIISLKGVEFEGEVTSLNLKTAAGEITVLNKHRPLITELVPGKAVVLKEGGDKLNFNIISGFLEVGEDNKVTILSD
jgi:F0F1-type ATP synthase epsilon subunit